MTKLAAEFAWLLVDVAIVAFLTAGVLSVLWFAFANLRDFGRALLWLGDALRRGRSSPETAEPEPLAPIILEPDLPSPPRVSLDAQWARVTGVVASGLGRTYVVERTHGAASVQIDAALYGLERLGAELTGLVPLPRPARGDAEIHWLRDRFKGRERMDRAEAA